MRAYVLASTLSLAVVVACSSQPPSDLGSPSGEGAGSATSTTTTTGTGGSGGSISTGTGGSGPSASEYFDENVKGFLDDGTGEVCGKCHSSQYTDAYNAPDF